MSLERMKKPAAWVFALWLGLVPTLAFAQPTNDTCSGAWPVQCGSVMVGDTSLATPSTLGSCGTAPAGSGGALWYVLAGNGDTFTITTCHDGTNYDTTLRVYSGSCGSLTCVTGNDDAGCSLGSTRSTVTFATSVGVDYFILVSGFSGSQGEFEFTVESDGPCVPTPAVDLFVTDDFLFMWSDAGTGGQYNGLCWSPSIPAAQQSSVFGFGSIFTSGADPLPMIVGSDLQGDAFALATSVDFIHNIDSGTYNGCWWRPVPPPGYVSLGDIAHNCQGPPPLELAICVRSDLVVPGSIGTSGPAGGAIYNDAGTGVSGAMSAWDIVAPPGAIDLGTFVAHNSYSAPTGPVWCLRADVVQAMAPPSTGTIDALVNQFGPIIRFHPNELFLPDDPAHVLDQSFLVWETIQNPGQFGPFAETILGSAPTSATTILDDVQAALSHPQAANSDFVYRLDYPRKMGGDLGRAEAYVRVQPVDGVSVELQFWIFYPWNGPGYFQWECGIFGPEAFHTGQVGSHYSDWENVRIRVTNRILDAPGTYSMTSAVLSRHSFEVEVPSTGLSYVGTRPVIYAAEDSHAHYEFAATHTYQTVTTDVGICDLDVDLLDACGDGLSWNTYQDYQIVSSAWPEIDTVTPDWFFFGGQWGGFEEVSWLLEDALTGTDLYNYQEVTNGKPGLLRRNEFGVAITRNADLGTLRTSTGVLDPPFDPSITNYVLTVAPGTTEVSFTTQAMNDEAVVTIDFDGTPETLADGVLLGLSTSAFTLLDGAANTATITVEVDSGLTKTSVVQVQGAFPEAGDECNDPFIATLGSNPFDTSAMTDSPEATDDTLCTGTFLGAFVQDAWFTYTAPADGLLTISTCDFASFDTDLAVYVGGCGSLVPVACSGDDPDCVDFRSRIEDMPVTAGTAYLIRVGGWEPGEAGTGTLELTEGTPPGGLFIRGDTNGDGVVNIADAIATLAYLFSGGPAACIDAVDANDDGNANIADAISTLEFLFSGGTPPAPPFPTAGADPTADPLGC